MSEDEMTAWLEGWYDRWAGPGESWTMGALAIGLCEAFTITPNREICPQPCEHLSQHDAREGRTCPEHPCTCTDRENGSER